MSWSVRVNGCQYQGWYSLKFGRSIKENTGSFGFETTETTTGQSPIRNNDLVTIFYKNTKVFTGFVDVLNFGGSRDGSSISYEGRGVIGDLVDSSLPDNVKTAKGNSLALKPLIEATLSSLGITYKVIDTTSGRVGSQKTRLQKVGASGSKAMSFLAKYAAALQVWLVENEDGDLEIIRAGEQQSGFKFYYLNEGNRVNNVIDASLKLDLTQSFYKIKARGKGSIAYNVSSQNVDQIVDIFGENLDDWSRKTRYLEIKNEDIKSVSAAKQRAIDEVNLRRAKACEYKILTNSFVDNEGSIMRIGQTVFANDEKRGMYGKFVIASFDVSFDRQNGTKVNVLLAPAEAYQIVDIEDRESKIKKIDQLIKKG